MSKVTAQQVSDYLTANPDFFVEHPEVFAQMRFTHPAQDVASLQLRQQQLLREQNQALKDELNNIHQCAHKNEQVYQVFSACHRLLMNDAEFAELAINLEQLICTELGLSECKLIQYTDSLDALVNNRLATHGHYLGRLSDTEQELVFETPCKSAALYLIGEQSKPVALLAFASEDELHFEPAQDSFFILEFVKALQERLATSS